MIQCNSPESCIKLLQAGSYESYFTMKLEHGPGMGIDIDLDALEHYRVGDPVIVQ